MPASSYLVFFVCDPVDDALAAAVTTRLLALARERHWQGPPPGAFDDPAAGSASERTVGGYLRAAPAGPPVGDVRACLDACGALSREHGIEFEIQWRERPLGRVRGGAADAALAAALARELGSAG